MECKAKPPRPVIPIGMPPDIQYDLSKYIVNRNALWNWKRDADANHEANLAPMEHNAKNAEIVARFLSEFIDRHYVSERPAGLAFLKHSRAVPGYVADLKLAYPTNDGYDDAIKQYGLRITSLEDQARRIAEKEEEARKAASRSNVEVAAEHLCIAIHRHAFAESETCECEMVPLALLHDELVAVERALEAASDARKVECGD